jgi:hypothetical protein
MKKSLLKNPACDEVIARIKLLTPHSKRFWGEMSVEEMLLHCNVALRRTMTSTATPVKSTLKQKLLKWYFFNIAAGFPKNVQAPKVVDVKRSQLKPEAFEEEQEKLIQNLREFQKSEKQFAPNHPIFGLLTRREWGRFTWMHLDHHLRQFGV